MKGRPRLVIAGLILILTVLVAHRNSSSAASISAPILKWQHGGCYSSWCETGWYSSPAVVDLDQDGLPEVAASPYTLFVLNGEDGTVQWQVDPPGGRTWPGVAAADIDDDGDIEIVVAQSGGYVSVYHHDGSQAWSQRPSSSELRGLSLYDLDADGTLEVIVTAAVGSRTNTWVLEDDGSLRPGWPQVNDDSGYAWGVFNDNAAIGDMDYDGLAEIVVPSDVHYINAFEDNGAQIQAHPMYGDSGWGKVGVHVSHEVDLRGYAHCGSEHRPNFATSPAVMADLDADGSQEIIVPGNVYNCGTNPYTNLYEMLFIFGADRSRWTGSGFDWTEIPIPDSSAGPLEEDYDVIESAMANPVVADLDGDSYLEILFASYDGRLHAYWLDKREHHSWPYDVAGSGPGIRFASEPVVADLDDDGLAEVIFASWPQKGSGFTGKLHVLDYTGSALYEILLPAPFGGADWNGTLAAPTIADIDGDPDLELVLNTAHSGIVAYDLPGTSGARILWGTGRGNYQRTGSLLVGSLRGSRFYARPHTPAAGETVIYTIELKNPGPTLEEVTLTSSLPPEVTYSGSLSATSGNASYTAGTVSWAGAVAAGSGVTITYEVTVNDDVLEPRLIIGLVQLDDGLGTIWSLAATIIANGYVIYSPAITR